MQGTKNHAKDKKSCRGQKIMQGTNNQPGTKNQPRDKKSAKGQKMMEGTKNHAKDKKYL